MDAMDSDTRRSKRALSRQAAKKQEALERLRSLKNSGQKNRLVNLEEACVYEEVDEESYAQLVSKRQRDDWIVDDDGGGYAEHGREIFDDEYDSFEDDAESGNNSDRTKIRNKYKLQGNGSKECKEDKKGDIRNMFNKWKNTKPKHSPMAVSLAPVKKSLNEVRIDNTEIDNLVDSITSTSKFPLVAGNSFQPLKLQRKQTGIGTPNSAKKRKTFESSKIGQSTLQQFLPPFKRRSNINTDLDFDQIIDKDEIYRNQQQTIDDANIKISIKQEPLDDFSLNDSDFTLPDHNSDDFDDIDSSNQISMKLKVEKFPEEEWIVSNSNVDVADSNETSTVTKTTPHYILPKDIQFEFDQDQNKLLKFYWFDAFHDPNSHSDRIFLFGKIYADSSHKQHVSCCLQVKNLERRIFILPREYFREDRARRVQMDDVREEFEQQIAPQLKLRQFRSRKVIKRYAFELDQIPDEAEYLEILYPASYPPFPTKFAQGNTYRHVFGTQASILENFILDKNLMGPGWLLIKNPEITEQPVSWCKLELAISKPKDQLSVLEGTTLPATPDFTLLSLCFKTFVHVETKTTEIVAISCLVNRQFNFEQNNQPQKQKKFDHHFCIITKLGGRNGKDLPVDFNHKMALKDYGKTRVEIMMNERELLTYFMAKFQQIDPDIIIGHDIYNFDYDILLQRFGHHKIPLQWSKLGRLKCSGIPATNRSTNKDKHLLHGRLVCDVKLMSRELLTRAKSYDLTELSSQLLRKGRFEIEPHRLPQYYEDSTRLIRLIEFLMKDNDLILSIAYELNCLPLCKQITNIAGNLLSRTLLGGRSERNEYLLLHAFNQRGYIVPDKADRTTSKSENKQQQIVKQEETKQTTETDDKWADNKKSSYTGGLVLEPKIGFYDRFILLMDFNSLYPSIIQEYNICFTTIRRLSKNDDNLIDLESSIEKDVEGVLPVEIRKLVESRREVKRQLIDPAISNDQRSQLDIKQKALKITANSMYGCLGYGRSRFYAKHLASMVTLKGREILLHTKEMVEKMGFEVIYGDTDSIMILTSCTKYEEVREIGRKIQAEVNKLYRRLEIDIDGVFRSMLLLKKKKYAALTVIPPRSSNQSELQYEREIKGLDIIRRDWSSLAKMAGEAVLDHILKPDQNSELIADQIHQYIKQLAEQIRSGQLELELFVINKALAKRPEEYGEQGKNLTHVMVALRYNQLNLGKKLGSGDTVPFIICVDGTKNSPTQRGYHLDEVRQKLVKQEDSKKENQEKTPFHIDIDYYLSQQVFPIVSRICEPLDGTDAVILAEFLGINYHRHVDRGVSGDHQSRKEMDPTFSVACGDEKYDCYDSLFLRCPFDNCGKSLEIRDLFRLWSDRKIRGLDLKEVLKNYKSDSLFELTLAGCLNCHRRFDTKFVEFYFDLELRRQIDYHVSQRFGQRWMHCDDRGCSHRTRYLSGLTTQKHIVCPRCGNGNLQPKDSEHFLYEQLTFFHRIFDFDRTIQRFNLLSLPDEYEWNSRRNKLKKEYGDLFNRLRRTVQYYLDKSSYNEFDLGFLFHKFRYNTNNKSVAANKTIHSS
ncbi:dna polymerase alpha catalytic subunit-like protein [Dermatophagoides farinae]|uniref:DNA polymerase n=1 Tax=Dermatophagoides farinae TaxID=6954 RepID=A0A9D4NW14_DERFA|nr:DNA polymerase alpha catalytic subunit-like [Dermatophagoides farinae]KAH7639346.1 dna polymerase alpha catalytic subunit-like protein [Dermatophagoides farinae]